MKDYAKLYGMEDGAMIWCGEITFVVSWKKQQSSALLSPEG